MATGAFDEYGRWDNANDNLLKNDEALKRSGNAGRAVLGAIGAAAGFGGAVLSTPACVTVVGCAAPALSTNCWAGYPASTFTECRLPTNARTVDAFGCKGMPVKDLSPMFLRKAHMRQSWQSLQESLAIEIECARAAKSRRSYRLKSRAAPTLRAYSVVAKQPADCPIH